MSNEPLPESGNPQFDLGDYCRRVEEHLARVNEGHIIRIVGTAFELVRGWALSGVPLGIVYRGIDQKAERHRAGRSKRPLRLEFCDGDVRTVYDDWRRAVGLMGTGAIHAAEQGGAQGGEPAGEQGEEHPAVEERRRPSITRQLDRAIDRLVRASSRLEIADATRDALTSVLEKIVVIREEGRGARGEARKLLTDRLKDLDREIGELARVAAGDSVAQVEAEATADLAAFRSRLSPEAWQRSVDAGVDRLLRDRFGFPTLDVEVPAS